ncbi:MAG: hypothetical protein HDQ95_08260 [Roseburia sp.]|nr:hypothetical protein [Roseburia sp.]
MSRLQCWKDIIGDGFAFEDIIGELLKVMFPTEKYTHTIKTRDGGKDFVCITQNQEKYWAECKNYTSPLATSDVAKTFVMAIAEDVKKVMLFSISPFTEIAIQEISSYTEKINYEVKLYDGDALNALMFQYINEINLSNDFRKKFLLSYHAANQLTVFSSIIKNNYQNESAENFFCIGDLFTYQFYFKNNTDHTIDVTFCINDSQIPEELLLITESTESQGDILTIEIGSYAKCSYTFRIINFRQNLCLFGLSYSINGKSYFLQGKNIKCEWIAEVPLLGEGRQYLQKLRQQFIESNELTLINVYGNSGVGKSRLIREIRNTYENLNKKIIFIPVQNTSDNGKVFIRKIVSMIKNLPYLPGESIQVNSKELVYQILYNSQFEMEQNFEEIFFFIYKSLAGKQKIIVAIDDLQFGDSLLIKSVKNILRTANSNIVLITGFNKDYLFSGTNADMLFKILKAHAGTEYNQNIELSNFDSPIAKEYVYNCLDRNLLYDNRLEKTIDLFVQFCGTNPLVLHQTILYLEQKRILEKAGDSFFVSDVEAFHQIVQTLTPELRDVLRERHKLIKENFSSDAYIHYLTFMIILSVFRKVTLKMYYLLFSGEPEEYLHQLLVLGLIKYNDDGDLTFYHQKLESFYYGFPTSELNSTNIKEVVERIPNNFFKEKFVICEKINEISQHEFEHALFSIDTVEHGLEYRFVTAIFLKVNHFNISKEDFLKVMECYYRVVQRHKGIRYKISEYEDEVHNLINDTKKYSDYAELSWRITLTCVNALIQLHLNKNALEILKIFESHITEFNCSENRRKNIQSALYNRLGVIYTTYNNIAKADNYLRLALKLGQETGDKYKIIEAYSDYGSLYYDKKGKIRKTYKYWNKLFSLYEKTNGVSYEYLIPKCYYHKIYVFLLQHKYKKAECLLKEYRSLYWGETEGHYKIKIIFMNIVLEMVKNHNPGKADLDELIMLINRVEDECVFNGTVREYYKVFYLKAIYFMIFTKEYGKAYENFQIAFKEIMDFDMDSELMIQKYLLTLQEIDKWILYLEGEYGNTSSRLLSEQYLSRARKKIQYVHKNNSIQFSMPLKSRGQKIKFPKL